MSVQVQVAGARQQVIADLLAPLCQWESKTVDEVADAVVNVANKK